MEARTALAWLAVGGASWAPWAGAWSEAWGWEHSVCGRGPGRPPHPPPAAVLGGGQMAGDALEQLTLARGALVRFRERFELVDVTLVAAEWPQRECWHHGNWQVPVANCRCLGLPSGVSWVSRHLLPQSKAQVQQDVRS